MNKLLYILIFMFIAHKSFAEELNYQRIVSLGPTLTEKIYLLEAEDKIVADTVYCNRPKAAKFKNKIGNLSNINIEKIISLQPDLVLVSPLTPLKQVDKLTSLNIKIEYFPYPKSFNDLRLEFIRIGKLVGKQIEAEKIIKLISEDIEKLKKKVCDLPKKKVFMQIGVKPLFTINKDSFINDFIEFAGGINIAKNSHSGMFSREKVVMSNPDIIIITTMGIEGEKEKERWKKYSSINAVKTDNIFVLDSYDVCSPTPLTFVKTLKDFILIIHPDTSL